MIQVDGLSFSYSKKLPSILSEVSFNIQKGEFVALIGQNGAGKTTLLKQLNGLLKPTRGSVKICGMDTRTHRTSLLARHIGYLFQNPDHQIFCETVGSEIEFGLKNILQDEDIINERIKEISALLSLGDKLDKSPFSLSRGERQRVALASVVALKPDILVLDEPTTGQDYRECMEIMDIVKGLNDSGTTVIMVSHDMEVVAEYARRTIVLRGGTVAADGATPDIFRKTDILSSSNLRPPQIVELALKFEDGFHTVVTAEDMYCEIARRCGK
ncbi:MAG: Energy-coupling factor transporter ATP-binding protein EcfA2 [Firmicutes bacterium ADurb.Bin193]|nr:MAG: Energy-coupling factor transporter ATP-binding protein EcfA2 [Firmicutes bacterium ADurb.Bin193]